MYLSTLDAIRFTIDHLSEHTTQTEHCSTMIDFSSIHNLYNFSRLKFVEPYSSFPCGHTEPNSELYQAQQKGSLLHLLLLFGNDFFGLISINFSIVLGYYVLV